MNGKNMLDLMGNIKPDFILEAEEAVEAHRAAAAEQAKAMGTKTAEEMSAEEKTKAAVTPIRAVKPRGELKWRLAVGLVASAFAIAGGILTYVYFGKNPGETDLTKATVIGHASNVAMTEEDIVTQVIIEESSQELGITTPALVNGIRINDEDVFYVPIEAEPRARNKYGVTSRDKDTITEDDLGELIGTVTGGDSLDQGLIGKKVYHYALYPDSNEIVIVETDDGYAFYTILV